MKKIIASLILMWGMIAIADDSSFTKMLESTAMPDHASSLVKNYLSNAKMLNLGPLNDAEEGRINRLLADETNTYLSINRAVSVSGRNWAHVGSKNSFTIWQLHIHSPGALGLQIWFSNFDLPDNVQVKVYGLDNPSSYVGTYEDRGLLDTTRFWSGVITGDTIIVEAWLPSGRNIAHPDDLKFLMGYVNHHFRDVKGKVQELRNQPSSYR